MDTGATGDADKALTLTRDPASSAESKAVVTRPELTSSTAAPRLQLAGLAAVEAELRELRVAFHLDHSSPPSASVPAFALAHGAIAVVTDHLPLRLLRSANAAVAAALDALPGPVPLIQVDAANVVPVWEASGKQEVGARTLRPKIGRL